jgi:hypothetical protein
MNSLRVTLENRNSVSSRQLHVFTDVQTQFGTQPPTQRVRRAVALRGQRILEGIWHISPI